MKELNCRFFLIKRSQDDLSVKFSSWDGWILHTKLTVSVKVDAKWALKQADKISATLWCHTECSMS